MASDIRRAALRRLPDCLSSRLCNKGIMRASRVSLHGRKRGWRQQLAADVLDELAILLRLGDHPDPFGIAEKTAPALLALRHPFPADPSVYSPPLRPRLPPPNPP